MIKPVGMVLAVFLLLGLAFFNLFYKVGDAGIASWDEARHGVSALEMIASKNYVVNTFQGANDYWNAKPPLAFWPMVAGFKIFGSNTFGLRFFSCLFTVLTAGMLVVTGKRYANIRVGLLAVMILLTTRMFIAHHNARSGDADATFIFFFTASFCLVLGRSPSFMQYCAACFFAALAFLTKSFHAGPLCLAIAVFFFMDNPLTPRTIRRGFAAFLCFLLPVFLWALWRYQYDGITFFAHAVGYDAVARLSGAIEGHEGKATFTILNIFSNFRIWMPVFFLGILFVFIPRKKNMDVFFIDHTILIKLLLIILFPILLYTISPTKLPWYAYSVYPAFSLLCALLLDYAFRRQESKPLFTFILSVVVVAVFTVAEVGTIKSIRTRLKRQYDPLQVAITEVSREHSGPVTIFLEKGQWTQSQVLAAMFTHNVTLRGGSTEAYNRWKGEKVLLANPKKTE